MSSQPLRVSLSNHSKEQNDISFNRYSSALERVIYRYKVILLGDIAVGKTALLSRFVDDKYTNEYKCNVGVEFKLKSLNIESNKGADLQIWDTVGEERFRTLTRQYYRDSKGIYYMNKVKVWYWF
jgi:GTPase SAR1 family protein